MRALKEIEFYDLDLEKPESRLFLKRLYAEGWYLIFPEKTLTNDGMRDFCKHLVFVERLIEPDDLPAPPQP